jgi:hypothetical protein
MLEQHGNTLVKSQELNVADIALWLKYDSSFMTYLVDYVGLDVEYKKIGDPINKDQLNLFIVHHTGLSGGGAPDFKKTFMQMDREVQWCNDNDITFVIDTAHDIMQAFHCGMQDVKAPNKFKIWCDHQPDPNDPILKQPEIARWLDNCIDVEYMRMNVGGIHNYRNLVSPQAENKYLFSCFLGDPIKQSRGFLLAGLYGSGLDQQGFISQFLHNPNIIYHAPEKRSIGHDFKYRDWFIDNYVDKIAVDNKFEGRSEIVLETTVDDKRIPMAIFESHFNIVSESYSTECYASYTEKTFKPIAAQKPFIISSSLGINNNLKNHDIENFPEIFDYSFESIESIEMYAQAFIDEILRVSKESISIYTQPSVLEKTKYNYERHRAQSSKENKKQKL